MNTEHGQSSPDEVGQILDSSELAAAIGNDRYKHLLDNVPVAVAVSRGAGADQQVVYVNKAFEDLMAMLAVDIEGKGWDVLDAFLSEDEPIVPLGQAIAENQDFLGVFRPQQQAEKLIIVQAYASVIESEEGTENFRIAALVDVGGRERAQRDLYEVQIRDRDTLLRELQHRVKNNLQLITALIRLEARSAAEGEAVALARLASRIDALTVLYRTLSGEDAAQDIDLGQYLADVTAAVLAANAGPGITCDVQTVYCRLSINLAMPIGLLVNEMLTNALKYAFVGRDGGRLKVINTVDGNRASVVVSDDGVGLGDHPTWPSPRKLGALVLQTLKENAKNVEFSVVSPPGQGAWFTLMFDLPQPARPS